MVSDTPLARFELLRGRARRSIFYKIRIIFNDGGSCGAARRADEPGALTAPRQTILPVGNRGHKCAPTTCEAGRDRLHFRVACANRVLIGRRQLADADRDRLSPLANNCASAFAMTQR